jgi:hypothetical protein
VTLIKDIGPSEYFWIIKACIVDISVGNFVSDDPELRNKVSFIGRILSLIFTVNKT